MSLKRFEVLNGTFFSGDVSTPAGGIVESVKPLDKKYPHKFRYIEDVNPEPERIEAPVVVEPAVVVEPVVVEAVAVDEPEDEPEDAPEDIPVNVEPVVLDI